MNRTAIIFEDETLLVIDKPAGIVVNRAESVKTETVQDWVESYYPKILEEQDKMFRSRSGMVHRLDKDTSGVLLWAKTPETMYWVMDQFMKRLVKKTYIVLVHGRMEPKSGEISLPMGRLGKAQRFGVVIGGRMTKTRYTVIEDRQERFGTANERLSLIEMYPETGRTHQLRVMLKHLYHPIVSDELYLGKRRLKSDQMWCERMFLHAKSVSLQVARGGKRQSFVAQMPVILTKALEAQGFGEIDGK